MYSAHNGITMWVDAIESSEITVAVQPIDAAHQVEILLQRYDQSTLERVAARWLWNDHFRNVQYFRAGLAALTPGDRYLAICNCAGRLVSKGMEEESLWTTFEPEWVSDLPSTEDLIEDMMASRRQAMLQNCPDSLTLSATERLDLAKEFAPLVYLYSRDDYRPSSVDWYLQRVQLLYKDRVVLDRGQVNPRNLITQIQDGDSSGAEEFDPDAFKFRLNIVHDGTRRGYLNTAKCYAHVRSATDTPDSDIDIQYWFFYPYNGRIALIGNTGVHEGDWEHVTVRVDRTGSKIQSVFYARHGGEDVWCDSLDACTTHLGWNDLHQSGQGDSPAVAVTDQGQVVDIHDGKDDRLYYRVGQLSNNDTRINWRGNQGNQGKGNEYDRGKRPAIAMKRDGTIIEVHQGRGSSKNLYYHIGKLNGTTIDWNKLHGGTMYDKGINPAIAIFDDGRTIVEVHNGGKSSNDLFWNLGKLSADGKTIDWPSVGNWYDTGDRPSIAITSDGTIIEVHDGGGNSYLYWNLGKLSTDRKSIDWYSIGNEYGRGKNPSVALTKSGMIVEIHDSAGGPGEAWLGYNIGQLVEDAQTKEKKLEWTRGPQSRDIGTRPSIAVNQNDRIVQIHNGREAPNSSNLFYQTGTFTPRATALVYSARHSHASYYTLGEHKRPKTYYLGNDYTDKGPRWHIADKLVLLENDPRQDTANPWNRFAGRWGDSKGSGGGKTPSPVTPGFKGSWCYDYGSTVSNSPQPSSYDIETSPAQWAAAGFQRLVYLWKQNSSQLAGAGFWHAANALDAYIDYLVATGDHDTDDIIAQSFHLYQTLKPSWPPQGPGDYYFDDQGWWGIALAKAYAHPWLSDFDANQFLEAAEQIWNVINQYAWDTTYCGGGCWWRAATDGRGQLIFDYKNAITNELFLVLSLKLWEATGNAKYLDQAQAEYNWFAGSGLISPSGLVIDGLNRMNELPLCGTTANRATWTYNQGVILGGLAALSRATGDQTPLLLAQQIADATISKLVFPDGILREAECECESSGGQNSCNGDAAQFKGIFMRYLNDLNQTLRNPAYTQFIAANASAVWRNRDAANNDFGQVWNAPYTLPGRASANNVLYVTLQTSGLDALTAAL